MKLIKISHKMPYIENTDIPNSPQRPKIENKATGKNNVAQLSNPWSNSSPSGDEDWVLLACFPSVPSSWKWGTKLG